jgi:hypothetical protein
LFKRGDVADLPERIVKLLEPRGKVEIVQIVEPKKAAKKKKATK